jgi:hypothetical protein
MIPTPGKSPSSLANIPNANTATPSGQKNGAQWLHNHMHLAGFKVDQILERRKSLCTLLGEIYFLRVHRDLARVSENQ